MHSQLKLVGIVRMSARLDTLLLSFGTVAAGTAAAVVRGNMEVLPALLCMLFAFLAQAGCNLWHSYKEILYYYANLPKQRMGEGRREEKKILITRTVREAAFACFMLALMVGFGLMSMADVFWWPLVTGVLVAFFAWLEESGKQPLVRNPWSLLCTFMLFGPIGVISTSLLQAQHESGGWPWSSFDSAPSLWMGPAVGLLAVSSHKLYRYIRIIIRRKEDISDVKFQMSRTGVEWIVFLCGVGMLALMIAMVWQLHLLDPAYALVPAFLGFALNTYIAVRIRYNGLTGLQHLLTLSYVNFALTWGLTFLMFWYTGLPDDSMHAYF